MTMTAVVLSALLLCQDAGDRKAADLIRDLGADDYAVRERAEKDLRALGDAALPALREALEDKDPERALRAHRVLQDVEKKGARPSRAQTWMAYRDFGRGLTFESHPYGTVELTVREGRENKTYKADSIEDFRKKYPELASKYDVDNLGPKEKWTFFDDPQDFWEAWRKRFDRDWFWDKDAMGKLMLPWYPFGSDAPGRWGPDQQKRFDAFRKPAPPAAEEGGAAKTADRKSELGIGVERAGSALADQLGLAAGEGLVITEVKPASRAERAGLRRYDVLLKANGKTLTGADELRRQVESGGAGGLEFELLRRGKRETVKVESAPANAK